MNKVTVDIETSLDCNPSDGEYDLSLTEFSGRLNLNAYGGVDDISLIIEAIENEIDFNSLPNSGNTLVRLIESGEWEGYGWHKYYTVLSVGNETINAIADVKKQAKEQEKIAKAMSDNICN